MFYCSKVMAVLGIVIFLTALPFTSMASTNTISSVSVNIVSDIKVGNSSRDVKVITDSDEYHVIRAAECFIPNGVWREGDIPILDIILETNGDYSFSNEFSKEDVIISGAKGVVSSVSVNNSDLRIFMPLEALKDDASNYDFELGELVWDEWHGTARWDAANDAFYYQVRLFRGSSPLTSMLTTKNPEYDFSSYITKSGTYTYKVRAISESSFKGDWKKSDSWHVTSSVAKEISTSSSTGSSAGPGKNNSTGFWLENDKGWWYCHADRSYTISNWEYINNRWYYFNLSGYMVTGWINWKSKWYYCGNDGAMYTNTTTPDGYYVGSDGAITGS